MTQLLIFKGQRLERPIGVDWFRQLREEKLLNLTVGTLIWYVDGECIESVKVTQSSKRLDTLSPPSLHGIQVFCSNRHKVWSPKLIRDGKPSGLYMISDREAAYEYYAHAEETVAGETKLRLVGAG